jgi:hypothetical protein
MITGQYIKKRLEDLPTLSTNRIPLINSNKYHTRSVTSIFEKNYNFEDASKEWCNNKIKHQNGIYSYK